MDPPRVIGPIRKLWSDSRSRRIFIGSSWRRRVADEERADTGILTHSKSRLQARFASDSSQLPGRGFFQTSTF
jgi:hypothetical protein